MRKGDRTIASIARTPVVGPTGPRARRGADEDLAARGGAEAAGAAVVCNIF